MTVSPERRELDPRGSDSQCDRLSAGPSGRVRLVYLESHETDGFSESYATTHSVSSSPSCRVGGARASVPGCERSCERGKRLRPPGRSSIFPENTESPILGKR